MGNISEHFSDYEFDPHGNNPELRVHVNLILGLEELRARLGHPLSITEHGGWRDPLQALNKSSLHGVDPLRAADLYCPSATLSELYNTANQVRVFRDSGIGLYPQNNFVHVDVLRDDPLRWVRINGRYYYFV